MNEAPRRRRRGRIGDEDDILLDLIPRTTSSPQEDIEPNSDNAPPDKPESATPSLHSKLNTIDRIRTELLEDSYHDELTEPHFSDDTHSWSDEGESVSSDYWHFLGRYE